MDLEKWKELTEEKQEMNIQTNKTNNLQFATLKEVVANAYDVISKKFPDNNNDE